MIALILDPLRGQSVAVTPGPEVGLTKHIYLLVQHELHFCHLLTDFCSYTSAVIHVGHAVLVPLSNFGRREDPWFS